MRNHFIARGQAFREIEQNLLIFEVRQQIIDHSQHHTRRDGQRHNLCTINRCLNVHGDFQTFEGDVIQVFSVNAICLDAVINLLLDGPASDFVDAAD